MTPVSSLMTAREAAAHLTKKRSKAVSVSAVWRMVNAETNPLPTIRIGRRVYIADLDRWLSQQAMRLVVSAPDAHVPAAARVRPRPTIRLRATPTKTRTRRFGTPPHARGAA